MLTLENTFLLSQLSITCGVREPRWRLLRITPMKEKQTNKTIATSVLKLLNTFFNCIC